MTIQSLKPYALLLLLALAFFVGLMVHPMIRPEGSSLQHTDDNPPLIIRRMGGFEFIQPIVKVEHASEAPELLPLKRQLEQLIATHSSNNTIEKASVHIKSFSTGQWTSVYPEERYHPASILKLGLLITILRAVEDNPELLSRKFTLSPTDTIGQNTQLFSEQRIKVGKSYSVRDLLEYMTAHSDNNATRLLAKNFDPQITSSIFKQLDLPEASFDRNQYTITVKEASSFLNALFNGAIINPTYAEYAASLLHKGAFQQGFVQALPQNTRIWNKYGEWHDAANNHELHETAVIFLGQEPYILTIMTRGHDPLQLKNTLQLLAKTTYQYLKANSDKSTINRKTSEPSCKEQPHQVPCRTESRATAA